MIRPGLHRVIENHGFRLWVAQVLVPRVEVAHVAQPESGANLDKPQTREW